MMKNVIAVLKETGLPYEIKQGGRHRKIILNGRFVGILPTGRLGESVGNRNNKNVVCQIRRAAKEAR